MKNNFGFMALVVVSFFLYSCDTRRDAEVKDDTVSTGLVDEFREHYARLASPLHPATVIGVGDTLGEIQISGDIVYVAMSFPQSGSKRYSTVYRIELDTAGNLRKYVEILNWEKKTDGLHAADRTYKEFPTQTRGAHYTPGDAEEFFEKFVSLMPSMKQKELDK